MLKIARLVVNSTKRKRKNSMKFDFTKDDFEYFVEKCMLNEEMKQILEMKIKGDSITKIAMELNLSESTVNRRVKQLKKKIMKVI